VFKAGHKRSNGVTKEARGVLKGVGFGNSREHNLGPMVVHDRLGAFPVSVGYLREVLEDAYQLNAMPGGGGGEGIEIAQWERCSLPRPEPRAVEDRERSGYARRARRRS
jgi:hypothetical protein